MGVMNFGDVRLQGLNMTSGVVYPGKEFRGVEGSGVLRRGVTACKAWVRDAGPI